MNHNNKAITAVGILAIILFGIFACKSKREAEKNQPPNVSKPTGSSFVIPNDTAQGVVISTEQLYVRACGNCHQLHAPQEYSAQSWRLILDSMQKRAHISDINKASLYLMLTGDTLK